MQTKMFFATIWIYLVTIFILPNSISQDLSVINICCSNGFTFVDGKCQDINDKNNEIQKSSLDKERLLEFFQTQELTNNDTMMADQIYQFRLNTNLPTCTTTGDRVHRVQMPINGQGDKNSNSNSSSNYGEIRPAGFIKYANHFYSPTEYCINGFNEEENMLEAIVCIKSCDSTTSSCLPKCCEPHQLLDSSNYQFNCVSVPKNQSWSPVLHQNSNPHQPLSESKLNATSIHLIHSHPRLWCEADGYFMYQRDVPSEPKVEFHILKNGGIYYQNAATNAWSTLPKGTYCIDGIYDESLDSIPDNNNVIYHCEPESSLEDEFYSLSSGNNDSISILYYIVLIISSIFLFITIIIHGLTLERSNINGRTLLCCFISLFCLYIFLAMLHASRLYLDKDPSNVFCWGIGVGLHFFFLLTFSWLSVVNFDLWFTFRTLRTLISSKSHKFVMYSIFAIGMPIIILLISLSMDYLKRHDLINPTHNNLITPNYGLDGCFFGSRQATLIYLYGPIGIILATNLLLFILTIISLHKLKKTSSIATNNCHQPRQSFHLFIKLFVLMGISWIFEVISWAAHPETVPWYWIIFDLINICQGIFIFLIFICKRTTIQRLEQKYPCFEEFTRIFCKCINSFKCLRNCTSCLVSAYRRRSSSLETPPQEMTGRKLSDTEISSM